MKNLSIQKPVATSISKCAREGPFGIKNGDALLPRRMGFVVIVLTFLLAGAVLLPWQAGAQESESPAAGSQSAAVEVIEQDYDWWTEIRKGGVTMLALGLLVIAALAFSLERFWSVREKNFAPDPFFQRILPLWNEARVVEVRQLAGQDESVLAQMVRFMAARPGAPYDMLMQGAADIGARHIKSHYRRTFPIAVIAMLAPLLGLLGTVLGMIGAFRTVAIAGEMGDASLLADDIGMALVTTAAGLIIAIPTLAIYHYFRQRIAFYGAEIEEQLDHLASPWMQPSEWVESWRAAAMENINGSAPHG